VSFSADTAQRRIKLRLCGHRDSPTACVVERAMPLSSSQIGKEMSRGKQLVSLCTFGHYLATAAAFAIAQISIVLNCTKALHCKHLPVMPARLRQLKTPAKHI